MINKNILFSIITVCYNSEKTIEKTIQSVLNQKPSNFEYILVDGNSTDNTVNIIKSFETKFKSKGIKFTWISEPDAGIYNAFNKGIKLSNGNWISFLGSDDYYLDNALELYTKELNTLVDDYDLIHSVVKVENGKLINEKWSWKRFRRKMNIAHVGAFHHKNYFKTVGNFSEKFKIAGDYELLLRKKQNLKTHFFNEITAIMGDSGISNENPIDVYRETTQIKEEYKSQANMLTKLDHVTWVIKYRIKRIINAIFR